MSKAVRRRNARARVAQMRAAQARAERRPPDPRHRGRPGRARRSRHRYRPYREQPRYGRRFGTEPGRPARTADDRRPWQPEYARLPARLAALHLPANGN